MTASTSLVTSSTSTPPSGVSPSFSLVAAVDHAEVLLDQVPVEGGEFMDPFPRDGPLGQKGESLSLSELRSRSCAALEQFAWNAIISSTAKVYRLAWKQFVIFSCKIATLINCHLIIQVFLAGLHSVCGTHHCHSTGYGGGRVLRLLSG